MNNPKRNTCAIFAMVGAFSVPSNQKANQKVAMQDSRVGKRSFQISKYSITDS